MQVASIVAAGKPDKLRARIGFAAEPFSVEVRKEQEPCGARRRIPGQSNDLIVRILSLMECAPPQRIESPAASRTVKAPQLPEIAWTLVMIGSKTGASVISVIRVQVPVISEPIPG